MKALTLPLWSKLQPLLGHSEEQRDYDSTFLMLLLVLLAIGLVMVNSASVPVAERLFNNPLHFTFRHLVYLGLGTAMAIVVLNIPVHRWHQGNLLLLALAVVGLVAVLVFGRTVNGATRWLALGPISIQPAEPAKLFFFVYLASYLVR